jgi:hypothetical protein
MRVESVMTNLRMLLLAAVFQQFHGFVSFAQYPDGH